MDAITIDGLDENDFRCSIENMLRRGQADEAAGKLRVLLEPYAGDGRILPSRFLAVSADDVSLGGWDQLGERIGSYDRPNHQISAVSITVTEPEEAGPHPDQLAPCVETSYFSDEAYPFSEAARSDLLDGYSLFGCEWQGNSETTDTTLSVEGIDDLFGAVARLEARLMDSTQPCAEEIRAGSLGACYLAVLVHQAVRDSIHRKGLPRALCVMAGSSGVYPFFDAPVISSEEYLEAGASNPTAMGRPAIPELTEEPEASERGEDTTDYPSLLSLGIRKDRKRPVLLLDPEEAEAAARESEHAAAQHLARADEPGNALPTVLQGGQEQQGDADLPPDTDWAASEAADWLAELAAVDPVTPSDISAMDDAAEWSEAPAEAAVPPLFVEARPRPSEHVGEPAGHRLRARLRETAQPSTGFTAWMVAMLQRLYDRFKPHR